MSNSKVALVTGGSSGIGFTVAHRFLKEGYRVVITGRNIEKLERAVQELGPCCAGLHFDMNWMDKIPGFVRQLVADYGSIDVLVNNAGINQKKALLDVTDEDFETIVLTNQAALFSLSREVARAMISQEAKGAIVHISSMAAHYGIPKVISYTASKAALEGMTRAMAVELSPLGIRVNCVAPGFIRTPMSSNALDNDPERKNKVLSRTPLGKLGEPEDIANAVFFLASEQAAFITGETLKVDGGNSIGF
ncbi:MAG: SDR family oxidoreductase [Phaeodactylibacter sp.]|nr:SDR family oxidoreductase [Phaeodactylibacter sp.]MCB9274124.1 SDR family oxidoreductase [Lewinellaceae bacterium]